MSFKYDLTRINEENNVFEAWKSIGKKKTKLSDIISKIPHRMQIFFRKSSDSAKYIKREEVERLIILLINCELFYS